MHPFTLNINEDILRFGKPVVMAVLNVTDDSFYAPSRCGVGGEHFAARVAELIAQGADIIDVGGCSTRPGSSPVGEAIEGERVVSAIKLIREADKHMLISVDTFRSRVAEAAVNAGANIINDVSGGRADNRMWPLVASLSVPYVLTHSRGTSADMQLLTDYSSEGGVQAAVTSFLEKAVCELSAMGVADVIVDPGIGFAKTPAQGMALISALPIMERVIQRPMLIGVSRKSVVTDTCAITAADALPATTSLQTIALLRGASILRVHDVAAARQAIAVVESFMSQDK